MTRFKGDTNFRVGGVVGGYSSADDDNDLTPTIIPIRIDPTTKRLLVDTELSASQYAEDSAHTSTDTGTFILAVRNDTLASLVSNDGDYAPLQVNATGAMFTDIADGGQLDTLLDTLIDDVDGVEALLITIDADTGAIKTAVEVIDNAISGSEMQVDVVASIPAGTNVIGKMRLVTATGDEITEDTDNSMNVTIVADDVGVGGGTQYAEDEDHAGGDTGTMALIIRDDALEANAAVNADLDYMPMRGDNYGALWVTLTDAAGSGVDASSIGGGTQYTEDAAAPANPVGTAMMMERDDALAGLTPAEGDWTHPFATAEGALWTQDFNSDAIKTAVEAIQTAVEIIDDWDDSNYANVNLNVEGSDVTVGEGVIDAQTLRVSIATDDDGVAHLATIAGDTTSIDADTTTIIGHVDGIETLLGTIDADTSDIHTNSDSMVTALQLIDDAVYVDDADWTDDTSKHLLVGGIYQSTPHSVTDGDVSPFQLDANGRIIANVYSASGLEVVQDTAADLNVTEASAGDIKTAVEAIQTAVEIIDDWDDSNFANVNLNIEGSDVTGGEGTIDAQTLRVTIATDDDGVAHLATIAGDTTNIETAVQLLDNAVYVDDADWTADTSSHYLVGGVTQATPSANTDGDTTPLITNALRELRTAIPESDLATASTTHVKKYYTASAPTDGIVWSPAAGKRWYITDLIVNVDAASVVTFEDDKTGGDDAVLKLDLAANSGVSHSFNTPLYSGEDAADLIVTASAGNIYVCVTGYEI